MNNKDKRLAVKIFDHFFKKANVSSIKIFCLNNSFILDVCDADGNWHTVYDIFFNFMYFNVPKDQCNFMRSCNVLSMELDDVLKEIKEIVITNCINGNALSTMFSTHFKTLVPAAKSLEELMVLIDLEA